jgi:hypothetical protein
MQKRHLGTAEPNVIEDRQMRSEAQFLSYQPEAEALRVLRPIHMLGMAVDND